MLLILLLVSFYPQV